VAVVTLNAALVTGVRVGVEAMSVYPAPALLMLRLLKVATPAIAETVVVPESVPPPGFAPIATVTLFTNVGSVLPELDAAAICTAGVIATPAAVVLGWTVKTRWVAAPDPPKPLIPIVPVPVPRSHAAARIAAAIIVWCLTRMSPSLVRVVRVRAAAR
jgi:hypothetical protein